MRRPIGRQRWALAGGGPPLEGGAAGEPSGALSAWVLNASDEPALVTVTLYFTDRPPAGPFLVRIGAERTCHLSFRQLDETGPVPAGVPSAAVLEASVPIVVQPTGAPSPSAEQAPPCSMAYPADA